MSCCKGNRKMNNLDVPQYLINAKEAFNRINPKKKKTEEDWMELYHHYNIIYPNSKGQPNQDVLIQILQQLSQFKNGVYGKY